MWEKDVKVAKDAVAVRAVQEIFLLANLQMHEKGDNSPLFIKTSMRQTMIKFLKEHISLKEKS